MRSLWLSPDVSPILFSNIVVNRDRCAATVQCITAVALRPRNPVVFASVRVVVIGFEPCSLQALKLQTPIIKRATGLRKCHPPEPAADDVRFVYERNGWLPSAGPLGSRFFSFDKSRNSRKRS